MNKRNNLLPFLAVLVFLFGGMSFAAVDVDTANAEVSFVDSAVVAATARTTDDDKKKEQPEPIGAGGYQLV